MRMNMKQKLHNYCSTYFSSIFFLVLLAAQLPLASSTYEQLIKGSSLSVENSGDVLVSPNGTFSAGFYPIGDNAYAFAIWFSRPTCVLHAHNCTVVWMANRDHPVNGRRSKLSMLNTGNLILTDAGQFEIWATDTSSQLLTGLQLTEFGNLVLSDSGGTTLWQSFGSPTDTLLPRQPLTRFTALVSGRSKGNYSSGFYRFLFDDDNVLRLIYDSPMISSVYWPSPWLLGWQAGRSTYDSRRIASIDSFGNFTSTDDFKFLSADYGGSRIQRRLTMDYDGNLRLYSREERDGKWVVSWQAIPYPCRVHGLCGENGICTYSPSTGRKCSCVQGYRLKNPTDWSFGCEPEFDLSLNASEYRFALLRNAEFYGYDLGSLINTTLKECEAECLKQVNCKGFQYKLRPNGIYECYPKAQLRNGQQTPNFDGDVYLKLPKANVSGNNMKLLKHISLNCPTNDSIKLERSYVKSQDNGVVKFMLWFAVAFGGVEIVSIFLVLWFISDAGHGKNLAKEGYLQAATGFKRFTFDELKEATKNFKQEIGRGGGGIVYKGILIDGRVAAVKRLYEANQAEGEFLAEVNTIGKLNHMNLIEMWGFCAEKNHRLLVYEYMEHGSLAEKLSSQSHELDWRKRYDIALGTAKGLAYLHDECLEWVLHCDVKPQNILLDSTYQPKVSDFGLSKLLDRDSLGNSNFSKIRGTRGYMAPEWVSNRPITSKVDVYSYGVVLLEMVTGMCPTKGVQLVDGIGAGEGDTELHRSLTRIKERKRQWSTSESWITEIIDPMLEGNYNARKMETLVAVALHCIEEDKDARPTMSQVVETLLYHAENDN